MPESLDTAYWILAISGSLVFLAKTVLLVLGADGQGDATEVPGPDGGHHGADAAFTLLSVQSLATLAMGTGWMGLLGLRTFELSAAASLVLALAFGLLLVVFFGRLMRGARRLESSGTLDLRTAIGVTGTVYSAIPEKGRGQVQVVVQGRLVTVDAVSLGPALRSGARIRVEGVDSGGLLIVAPA
jgi:membrane protein implicated in regulation of membrane protease activity